MNKAVIGTVKVHPADAWVDRQILLAKRLVLNGPKQGRDEYRQVLEREWEELRPRYRACWEAAQAALAEHAATVAAKRKEA